MKHYFLTKSVGGAMVAAFMVTSSAERVEADVGQALGTIAAICILSGNCGSKPKPRGGTRPSGPKKPSMSQEQRQENRDVQSSLNAFNFPVGAVDGSLGKKSRAAIGDYQNYMGYGRTGQLTNAERQILVDGWRKLNAGGANAYPRTMAATGPRGLLNIARDPNFPQQFGDNVGQNGTNFAGNGNWSGGNDTPVPQQVPSLPRKPTQPSGEVITDAPGKVRVLTRTGQPIVSAAARCELVTQTTRIQGGVVQAANMTDSNQALSEKFCEARGFAITQGGTVASEFQVSENELETLCGTIQDGFAGVLTSLPSTPEDQIMVSARTAALAVGIVDASTAATYGQICMGIGYRLDNEEMALAGSLAMLVAGQAPYGEMVGHHLREGFGVSPTPAAAVPYYRNAMTALEQGAAPAFVPSTTPERIQVIRAALELDEQRASNSGQGLPQLIQTSGTLPALITNKP